MGQLDAREKSDDQTADVTTSSAIVLRPNSARTYALLINDSDTVIYLAKGRNAALNTGIRLNANGGSYEITKANPWRGAIQAIHGSTGNKVLLITEDETDYPLRTDNAPQ